MRSSRYLTFVTVAALAVSACGSSSSTSSAAPSAGASAAPISLANVTLVKPGFLTIGSDIPYAPQEFYDASHNPAGFDVEIGKELARRLGLKPVFLNQDFEHMIAELNNKKFDLVLSAMTINSERSAQVSFVPYFKAGASMLVQAGKQYLPKTPSDLCGHHVGVETSTVEADAVKELLTSCGANPPKVESFGTDPEGVEQLRQGLIEVEFTDSTPAAYAAKESKGKLVVSSGILDVQPQGIAVAKANTSLSAAIGTAFAAMQADGTYARLLDAWGLAGGSVASAP